MEKDLIVRLFALIIILLSFSNSLARITSTYSHDLAVNYAWLAAVGYCTPAQIAEGNCCMDQLEQNSYYLLYNEKIQIDDITVTILRNDQLHQILVTFTGTRSKFQLLKEFYASLQKFIPINDKFKEVKLMTYFKSVYDEFIIKNKNTLISRLISLIAETSGEYQFVFVGHSLGGALATIFAREFSLIHRTEDSPVLLSFASPRVGNFAFANSVMTNVPIVFRIAMDEDPVTKFPFCNLKDGQCINMFNTTTFVEKLEFNEENSKDTFPWHIGGLVLYKQDFTTYTECGLKYGEFNLDNSYCSKLSDYIKSLEEVLNDLEGAKLHGYYFINKTMTQYCSATDSNKTNSKPRKFLQ